LSSIEESVRTAFSRFVVTMAKGEAEAESSSGESALSPHSRKFIFVRVFKSAGLINDQFAGVCRMAKSSC
jgi:hypothetical protein